MIFSVFCKRQLSNFQKEAAILAMCSSGKSRRKTKY
jgi:hypothetical protein